MDWEQLDSLIEQFERMIYARDGLGRVFSISSRDDWKNIWEKASQIQQGFKGIRYPTRSQREEAWTKFNELRDQASTRSDEEFEERRLKSEERKSEILSKIESSRPNDLFGFDPINVEDMKVNGRVLKNAGKMLSNYKNEMLGEDKQECFHEIQEMRSVHDSYWEELSHVRDKRHEEYQDKFRRNIERNNERLRKASDALSSCRRNAEDLRYKISTSNSDNWIDKAEGWLSELEDKISDIESSINRIEEWINEDENKLD